MRQFIDLHLWSGSLHVDHWFVGSDTYCCSFMLFTCQLLDILLFVPFCWSISCVHVRLFSPAHVSWNAKILCIVVFAVH